MVDNEIIKALECCLKNECDECQFKDNELCQIELMKLLFDLINRLQSNLIDKEKQLQEALKSMAVNKTKVIDCEKEINRQKAENERLKNAYKQCAFERDAYIEIENTAIAEAKAEAYKEFAEKLKEQYKPYVIMGSGVAEIEIDKTYKKLVGENK